MRQKIVILGGGTVSHVRAHLALCTPAYGKTAKELTQMIESHLKKNAKEDRYEVVQMLTKMAGGDRIETNEDAQKVVSEIIADPSVRGVIFNIALCDFNGSIDGVAGAKKAPRLKSRQGKRVMELSASEKLIGQFRAQRKDLFVVGFKTTTEQDMGEQYSQALRLLKENSLNLVVANDISTRVNFIVAPEETRYGVGRDRQGVLEDLVQMMMSRIENHFTRSSVVPSEPVQWGSELVPENLRQVVNHCIERGAYKPILGKTAGHFAIKVSDDTILTSIRKSNFNNLKDTGLVKVVYEGDDKVIAYGAKPSVGAQSQRIIFSEHEQDCIVHFHCPIRPGSSVNVTPQWPNECGSHECGANTSNNLTGHTLSGNGSLKAVYLDEHGPNIVFDRTTPAQEVIEFIERNFDLSQKTGGLVQVK